MPETPWRSPGPGDGAGDDPQQGTGGDPPPIQIGDAPPSPGRPAAGGEPSGSGGSGESAGSTRTRRRRGRRGRATEERDDRADRETSGSPMAREGRNALASLARSARRAWSAARQRPPEAPPPPPWWVFAGIGLAVVVTAAIALAVSQVTSPPPAPYVPVADVEQLDEAVYDQDRDVMFVPTDGEQVLAFAAPEDSDLLMCEETGNIESTAGRVWDARGRALDGAASLTRHRTWTHEGVVYLNPESSVEGPGAGERSGVEPTCVDSGGAGGGGSGAGAGS